MGAGWWKVQPPTSGGAPPPATKTGLPSPTPWHPANLQPKKHDLSFSQCFAKSKLISCQKSPKVQEVCPVGSHRSNLRTEWQKYSSLTVSITSKAKTMQDLAGNAISLHNIQHRSRSVTAPNDMIVQSHGHSMMINLKAMSALARMKSAAV